MTMHDELGAPGSDRRIHARAGAETGDERRNFLFLLASARRGGNSESLACRAAVGLPAQTNQTWLRLPEVPLPPFHDLRHDGGVFTPPQNDAARLLAETLAATDLVFVCPLYWYSVPASAKLYLDHWSGWLRLPGVDFRQRMRGKTLWSISTFSGEDPGDADPLFGMLRRTADYMGMRWGGQVLGHGNAPDAVLADARALTAADTLFSGLSRTGQPAREACA
jgi:multimeric flavodoxin WrbA